MATWSHLQVAIYIRLLETEKIDLIYHQWMNDAGRAEVGPRAFQLREKSGNAETAAGFRMLPLLN